MKEQLIKDLELIVAASCFLPDQKTLFVAKVVMHTVNGPRNNEQAFARARFYVVMTTAPNIAIRANLKVGSFGAIFSGFLAFFSALGIKLKFNCLMHTPQKIPYFLQKKLNS